MITMVYSKAQINMSLFKKPNEERTSDRAPHATGYLEISVADLNEFFSLAMALEPVDNWKGEPCIKLSASAWHKDTRAGKPYESLAISPQKAAEFKEQDAMPPHTAHPPLAAAVVVDPNEEV